MTAEEKNNLAKNDTVSCEYLWVCGVGDRVCVDIVILTFIVMRTINQQVIYQKSFVIVS